MRGHPNDPSLAPHSRPSLALHLRPSLTPLTYAPHLRPSLAPLTHAPRPLRSHSPRYLTGAVEAIPTRDPLPGQESPTGGEANTKEGEKPREGEPPKDTSSSSKEVSLHKGKEYDELAKAYSHYDKAAPDEEGAAEAEEDDKGNVEKWRSLKMVTTVEGWKGWYIDKLVLSMNDDTHQKYGGTNSDPDHFTNKPCKDPFELDWEHGEYIQRVYGHAHSEYQGAGFEFYSNRDRSWKCVGSKYDEHQSSAFEFTAPAGQMITGLNFDGGRCESVEHTSLDPNDSSSQLSAHAKQSRFGFMVTISKSG